jgi:hypothetical protein
LPTIIPNVICLPLFMGNPPRLNAFLVPISNTKGKLHAVVQNRLAG